MLRYDILIPSCGPGTQISRCLQAIGAHSKDYRVVWLDNGAPTEVYDAALEELSNLNHIEIISPTNIGIAKGYSACMALSTAPYVVIMNDDVYVKPQWLENMERLFHLQGRKVGIAACAVTKGGWIQASQVGAPKDGYIIGQRGIPMYCTMISRECIEEVGYFDERFRHGCGADDDFSRRAVMAGFETAVDLRTVVEHDHQASSLHALGGAAEKAKRHKEAAELLKKKYGNPASKA